MKDDSIYIIDDGGNECEMKIYFTFDYNDKQYVILYPESDPENMMLFEYDDEGNLYEAEEGANEIAQEILDAYEEEN